MLSTFLLSCEKHVKGCIGPLSINNIPGATCDYGGCIYSENQ